jgi:CubicO group peptidase (beta-lactamase class C family)
MADEEKKIPNTNETAINIASVGKVFTATLILKLVEEGKLALHQPIQSYLPKIRVRNSDRVTIHHLLTHTAGYGNYMTHKAYGEVSDKNPNLDELINLIEDLPVVFEEPGTRFGYSNSGYILLGKILENIYQKPYEQVLSEVILKPLGMNHTRLKINRADFTGLAKGYWKENPQDEWLPNSNQFPSPQSDGGLFTTPSDLLLFDRALYGGKLLKPETLQLMTTEKASGQQPGFGRLGYGYGLMVATLKNNVQSSGHNGGTIGYNAEYRHYQTPAGESYTLIMLANHDRVMRPLFMATQEMIENSTL